MDHCAAVSLVCQLKLAEFGSLWARFQIFEIMTTQNLQLHCATLVPCLLSRDSLKIQMVADSITIRLFAKCTINCN